ncbi:GntR family transcriptional regulator [Frankia sp. CNm7]|uniref:GntR family transcriptional regulator n=1 Tax=Frankia nepalensis TaxID=1836974 RepID=A0A937RRX0_9ACTN|nr:GntR family transcriptional regulator [Frankia nepalensis]MBL7500183.1 GntR family transcriptional regulator [Frankia nepalensis]MBL7509437.1 GntR family transcriptional regulator [Frankia nepalensis]MBL7524805.1 GntR family transcriptional regulator [Frankia nepalensis]MBL7631613.1 GntR family transcriptional regulator [Frankia nepalensis]
MPPTRTVKLAKASNAVVDYILEEIFEGRLRGGQRVDLVEVGDTLGLSRSPVREGLVMLERDGIVSIRPHRGVFVEPFDAESVLDDFEVIGLLSGVAVSRLASRRDPAVVAELEHLIAELKAAGSTARIGELVQQIFRTQHRAGGSRRLRAELRAFAGFVPWVFRFESGMTSEEIIREQEEVLAAIVAGDSEAAARHRAAHFRAAGERVVAALGARGIL